MLSVALCAILIGFARAPAGTTKICSYFQRHQGLATTLLQI